MKRKVIQLAGRTLVVSLPHEWAKKNNIRKGDELDVEEQGEKLAIGGRGEQQWMKGRIDISGSDPMIKRILGAHYKAGYNEVDISFSNLNELETAKQVIRDEFIGFEIINHQRNMITLKQVSRLEHEEFHNMLRRMIFIIKSVANDGLEAIQKKDGEYLKSIALRDNDVNKIADFCRRLLNISSKHNSLGPTYFVVEQLEKIADIFKDICTHNSKGSARLSKPLEELFREIISYFDLCEKLLFSFSMDKITDFGRKRYQLRDKINTLYSKMGKSEVKNLFFLNQALESIFDLNGPLMVMNLANNGA